MATSLGWQARAACWGAPLGLFFGAEGERPTARAVREEQAKAICRTCPVRSACLDFAVDPTRPEKAGVWGALGEDERVAERRRRMRRKTEGRAA